MSAFSDALLSAQLTLAKEAGETVDLWRSGNTTSDVEAVPGEKNEEATNYDGVTRTTRIQAFLIKVADYQISATAVTPEQFDRLFWDVNGDTLTFEAMSYTDDGTVYEYTDSYRTHYRIFYKLIDEADI